MPSQHSIEKGLSQEEGRRQAEEGIVSHSSSWYLSLDRQGRFLPDTLMEGSSWIRPRLVGR